MLEQENMLAALYTDTCSESLIGKVVSRLGRQAASVSNLDRWNIKGVPRSRIYSSDLPCLYQSLSRIFMRRQSSIQLFRRRHDLLSKRMRRWGVQGADILYSMYHENLEFVKYAKANGVLSAVDVFVSPCTDAIMQHEMEEFPDWGTTDNAASSVIAEMWQETAALADVLICPSEWVAEGVVSCTSEAQSKIRVVPYGCSMDYGGQVNKPVLGRVLFAGRDPLRKGLHYLGRAAAVLKNESSASIEVRVAGSMPPEVTEHPVCKDLTFLGQLDRAGMRNEFLTADCLVLPALSEGFAGVVAEAIGAGCPVVVTKEAGSPVRHEREGLLIPSRDHQALAEAVSRLVTDRELRDRCSAACLKQVEFYSETMWRKRLSEALREIVK